MKVAALNHQMTLHKESKLHNSDRVLIIGFLCIIIITSVYPWKFHGLVDLLCNFRS